ncbi:MAG: autotransporter domain-containing protein [Parvibaculum sp.]
MTSGARLTDAAGAAGIAEKINNGAYNYYSATVAETSGDGGAAKGLKRLFAAALLSSTSVMAFGVPAGATPAACVQDGSPSTYTCSGDNGDTSVLIMGDGLTVTADETFSIETTGEAFGVGVNAGIRVTGDASTLTNYGSVTTSVTPSHYTYSRHDALSVSGMSGTSRVENKDGGYASTTSDTSFALYAFSGETAETSNAGTVVTTGDHSDALVSRGGSSALAENSGSVTASGISANGLIAVANNGTATANNLEGGTVTVNGESAAGIYAQGSVANVTNDGTIYVTDSSSTGIALTGDTVTGTNNGTIEVSGDYSTAMFGNSYGLATTNLVNNGTITVTSEYSTGVVGTGPTVNITNAEGATISSGASGIAVIAGGARSGTISNAGTITGDVNGGGDRRVAVKARATSGMTVENTGTIDGTINFAYATDTTVNNIGGAVGDGEVAISLGYGENTVTISGDGNVIDGSIVSRVTRVEMNVVPFDIDVEPEPEPASTLNFQQTDTLVLNSGYSGRAIENFQTVNFFDGVTEFYGVDIVNSGAVPDGLMDGDGGIQPLSMEASGTQVNVYNGATARVSGGYVTFDAHTVNVTGNSDAPAAERVATLSVAADSEIHVSGDVTFGALGRFTVGVDEPYAVEDRSVQLKRRARTNGFLDASTITFEDDSQIYADVTRGIELTDGGEIQIADANNGILDYGVSVYDNTTLFDFTHEIRSGDLGDQLYLIVERVLTASQATDNNNGRTNAKSIADAIDRFIDSAPADNPIVIYLAQFPLEEQEEQLYKLVQDSLPSESNADGSNTVVSSDMVLDLVMDRLSGGGGGVADAGTGRTGVSAGDQALGGPHDIALWGRIGGSVAEYTPDNINGFDSDTFAASLGADGEFAENLRLGIALFYSDTSADENGAGANSSQKIEGYGVLVYGTYRPDDYYINATFGYGLNNYDSTRLALGGANVADYDGTQIMTRMEAGKVLNYGKWEVTPHLGLRANFVSIDGYTETGPLPTTVASQDITSVRGVLGVGARYTHEMENGAKLVPEFHLRGIEELADPNEAITGSIVGGGSFVSQSEGRDRFSLAAGAGLTYEIDDKVSVRLLYDGEFQSDYQEHGLTAAIRFAF